MYKTLKKEHQLPKQHPVIYLVGDNYCDKQIIREFFLRDKKEECQKINDGQQNSLHMYYSNVLGKNKLIEVYDFPTDRFVRQYLDIYFEILPTPNLIIYSTDIYSSKKQLQQWVQLIQNEDLHIAFISDVHNLTEKSLIIKKISYFFQKPVNEHVYLPNIDRHSLYECLANIDHGISLKSYVRRVNTWSALKGFIRRLSYFFNNKSLTHTSVV